MRKLLLFLSLLLFVLALDVQAAKAQQAVPTARIRIIVTPLQNGAAARSLSALATGLPAIVAERLEDEPGVEPLNGPLILTKEQVRLDPHDLAAMNALAASRGATHFLAGRMSGQTWQWTFVAELYEVRPEGARLVGTGTASGDLTDEVKTATGRVIRTQSQARVQALYAQAVAAAFSAGGHPLAAETVKALETPPTADAFAFLKYSRAVVRYFAEDDGSGDSALGMAEVAVRIDPAHAEAQRFYAHLLEEAGKRRLARLHYEFAVEKRPKDVRSLVALGKLELNENNPDIARGYLERAVGVRPFDGDTRYWLGRSLIALELPPKAIIAFEDARTLWPTHVAARRELATLYAGYRRYRDAAGELHEVVKLVPDDVGAVFLEAACLRAAGDRDAAYDALGRALVRFPKEARLRKFRGDLRLQAGDVKDAQKEYREAARLAPDDPRLKAILDGSGAQADGPLGGEELLAVIVESTATVAKMEDARAAFQKATNDAIFDLHLNKEKGCLDGAAASSALLARAVGKQHAEFGTWLAHASSRIAKAGRGGEDAALTPDESVAMKAVIDATAKAERDVREMRGSFQNVLLPLYRQYKCETYDGPLTASTLEAVAKKDADRRVELPVVKPPLYSMPFTPQIEPDKGRVIRFNVDNSDGKAELTVVLDGEDLGSVLPGMRMTFFARLGPHRLCLRPKDGTCGDGSLRAPFLHDGWTVKVRPAK